MTHRWKDISCSWFGRINIIKMTIPHKVIYRFNAIPIKLLIEFFTELEQKDVLKFVWKHKRYWIPKAILRKRNRAKGMKLTGQIILQSPLMQIWSLSLQEGKQWKENNLFNKWSCEYWTALCKRMKWEHYRHHIHTHTHTHTHTLKWIKYLT